MNIIDIIAKKRDGLVLTAGEIAWFVNGAARGQIPDYQSAALLMAIRINGMTDAETADMALAMMRSGDVADLSPMGRAVCDKHSTGGVGDSVTLIALPIAAACGVKIAKMSGRGLGHTGGTIDKLESIGVDTNLSISRMIDLAGTVGMTIARQNSELAPADKAIYALRDVTATVDSIPLIASSILSKKLATGANILVLDVKTGSGALMPDLADALTLAAAMKSIAGLAGRRAVCAVTDMSQPLGRYIGNRLEVYESVMTLSNQTGGRLLAVALMIAALMIKETLGVSLTKAREMAASALTGGCALSKFRDMIVAQNGDPDAVDRPQSLLRAPSMDVLSPADGYVTAIRADEIGKTAQLLGAGRLAKDDVIDPDAGVAMHISVGCKAVKGRPLATLYFNDAQKTAPAAEALLGAVDIGPAPAAVPPLIHSVST